MRKFSQYYPGDIKVTPDSIAGMIGLPHVGEIFYVDPGAGSDTANSGTSPDDAFATVTQGYAALTADQDDVLVLPVRVLRVEPQKRQVSLGRKDEPTLLVTAPQDQSMLETVLPLEQVFHQDLRFLPIIALLPISRLRHFRIIMSFVR